MTTPLRKGTRARKWSLGNIFRCFFPGETSFPGQQSTEGTVVTILTTEFARSGIGFPEKKRDNPCPELTQETDTKH